MARANTEHENFAAFIENPNDIEVLHEVAKALNIVNYEIINGGVKEAIETYVQKKSPLNLIIDISKSDLPVSDLSRLSEVCEPGVNVIAIGDKNEVALYRDLMRLGIYEYLVCPLFYEILGRSLKTMIYGEEKEKGVQLRHGKVIACVGARGGVGSTFLTSNLSSILSIEQSRRTVMVDLDLHFGTLALNLDLKANYGLRDALENPERIDNVFIERLLTPVDSRLFLLSSEEPLDEQLKYRLDGLEILINFISKQFHYVIVDVPHYSDNITKAVISNANVMVLVTEPTLAGLRDTGRLIRLFGTESAERRVIVVMNKVGQYKKNELKVTDFEEALKHKVNYIIPYDPFIPMECLNRGKTLATEENHIAAAVRSIVDDMLGIRKSQAKTGGLSGFFKKFKLN